MRQNALKTKGLTISEAQSISNAINQRARDIESTLSIINSAQKTITVDGVEYTLVKGNSIPDDIVDILKEKASLHACQAFLMENLKAKESLLNKVSSEKADLSSIEEPDDIYKQYPKLISEVKEEWGWEQLTSSELEEYYEAEAYAAHIGQFIHKGSKLETLRKETPILPSIEWKEVETGKRTPVKIQQTHKLSYLTELHNELSQLHKQYENKTNYYKAKVKNLVTEENGRIAKINNDEINKINSINKANSTLYQEQMKAYQAKIDEINSEFETQRSEKIKSIVALRIEIPTRFQPIIDKVNNK